MTNQKASAGAHFPIEPTCIIITLGNTIINRKKNLSSINETAVADIDTKLDATDAYVMILSKPKSRQSAGVIHKVYICKITWGKEIL